MTDFSHLDALSRLCRLEQARLAAIRPKTKRISAFVEIASCERKSPLICKFLGIPSFDGRNSHVRR